MENNKIPQEIEEKILKGLVENPNYKDYVDYVLEGYGDVVRKAIQLSYEAGQKQAREDVLKLICSQEFYDKLIKLMSNEEGLPKDNRLEMANDIIDELKRSASK
jgi:hypothetical protein